MVYPLVTGGFPTNKGHYMMVSRYQTNPKPKLSRLKTASSSAQGTCSPSLSVLVNLYNLWQMSGAMRAATSIEIQRFAPVVCSRPCAPEPALHKLGP